MNASMTRSNNTSSAYTRSLSMTSSSLLSSNANSIIYKSTSVSTSSSSTSTSSSATNLHAHIPVHSSHSYSSTSLSSTASASTTSATSSSSIVLTASQLPPSFLNGVNFTSSTLSTFCAQSNVSSLSAVQEKDKEREAKEMKERETRTGSLSRPSHSSLHQPLQPQQPMPFRESSASHSNECMQDAKENDADNQAMMNTSSSSMMMMESETSTQQKPSVDAPPTDSEPSSVPASTTGASVYADPEEEESNPNVIDMDVSCCSPMADDEVHSVSDINSLMASVSSSSSPSSLMPMGRCSSTIPANEAHLWSTDYTDQIMAYWFSSELRFHPPSNYLVHQTDLNDKIREILIDWLHEVSVRFRLQNETMFLCVNLLDRFLSKRIVMRKKLQLVGCVCLFLAAKYEEIYIPELKDFLIISADAYDKSQMLHMETIILNTLNFELTTVSSLRFLQRFLNLPGVDRMASQEMDAVLVRLVAMYLLENTLQHSKFLQYKPSTLAASVVYIICNHIHQTTQMHQRAMEAAALEQTQQQSPASDSVFTESSSSSSSSSSSTCSSTSSVPFVWNEVFQNETRHREDELVDCVREIYTTWHALSSREALAMSQQQQQQQSPSGSTSAPAPTHCAVFKKYGKERFGCVNQMQIIAPSWM